MVRHRSRDFALAADRPPGDAAVTGHGLVQDRPVFVFAQDFTVFGGSVGEVAGEKITRVMDLAMRSGAPIVGISDGVGGRIQEGVVAQGSYGEIFARNVRMSGLVPQISLMMGPCAGGGPRSDGRGRRPGRAGRSLDPQHALRYRASLCRHRGRGDQVRP
jgi:propionyl-CoA carboxylase beta chain